MSARHSFWLGVCSSTEDVHNPSVLIKTVNQRNCEYEVLRGVMLRGGIEAQQLGVYTMVKRYKYPFILPKLNKNPSPSNYNSLCFFSLSHPAALFSPLGKNPPFTFTTSIKHQIFPNQPKWETGLFCKNISRLQKFLNDETVWVMHLAIVLIVLISLSTPADAARCFVTARRGKNCNVSSCEHGGGACIYNDKTKRCRRNARFNQVFECKTNCQCRRKGARSESEETDCEEEWR